MLELKNQKSYISTHKAYVYSNSFGFYQSPTNKINEIKSWIKPYTTD